MSSVDVDGPPDTKRFRIDLNTQVVVDAPSVSSACSVRTPVAGEASQDGQSPAAPSSASYRSSNGSVVSSSESPIKEEENSELNEESEGSTIAGSTANGITPNGTNGPCDLFDILNKTVFAKVFSGKIEEDLCRSNGLLQSIPPSPSSQSIPGALAVAQTPAAQLFQEDDWSWHRNPAASIRSGGTNKQTPVWKYFVYNKAENLSRCIIGDCTYMLKGPHTSTLACHLKKHNKEYAEFQKLKAEYSRTKMEIQNQQPKEPPMNGTQSPSATSIDLSVKPTKPKKETISPKVNDINFFMNAFRSNNNGNTMETAAPAAAPPPPQIQAHVPSHGGVTSMPQMPALMQNMMMSMNPLHMMLAQSMPTTSTTNGLSALQQAGLAFTANGQIIQSKKWRKDDKKQKDVQTRLALALSTSHIPLEVLQNPIWKDLFDVAQPKYNMSIETNAYDQIVNSTYSRFHQALKNTISQQEKLNLLVDTVKISSEVSKITIAAAISGANGNSYETQVILLGLRTISTQNENTNAAEEISKNIETIMAEYGINAEMINRVICSGFEKILGEDCSNIVDKQMESFGSHLLNCLYNWFETSSHVENLKKAVFHMIISVIATPAAIQMVTKLNGGKFDIPINEPFPVLIETILSMKECFQLHQIEGFSPLSDVQWSRVYAIHQICQMFKPFVSYNITELPTVDTVIPTIQQIKNVLEKDAYQLGEASNDLLMILKEKLNFVTDPEHEEFDSTFVQSTALNPQLAVVLTKKQMNAAKEAIEKAVNKKRSIKKTEKKLAIGVDSILANVMKGATTVVSSANDDMTSMYNDLLKNLNRKETEESKENIVQQYFEEITCSTSVETIFNPILRTFGNPLQAPIAYWKSCSSKCPELASLACELLTIPVLTLTAEKVINFSPPNASSFSQLNSNLILTNLENSDQFEKQLLMRFNRSILSKFF